MPHPPALTYRPDIDGLRAIAVSSVVAYHAAPAAVPGGFAGVDIFYVISGYLITQILVRERLAGDLSIFGFYARRIRRLFPALLLVLVATLALGWLIMLPHEFVVLGKHAAAGALYVVNLVLRDEAGYFDAAAESKPLLHLWSLAIEEQYYLVWPVVIALAIRWRRLFAVIVGTVAVSLVACLANASPDNAATFYLPQYRFWELAIGSLLGAAAVMPPTGRRWPKPPAALMSTAGLTLVLLAVLGLDRSMTYPGALTLLPVLGAALLIAAGPATLLNRVVLAHPAPVFVGLISYALYLWHWPLLSILTLLEGGDRAPVRAAAVGLAVALAIATYLLVERPIRRRASPVATIVLFLASLAVVAAGLLAASGRIAPRLDRVEHRQVGEAIADWAYPDGLEPITEDGVEIWRYGSGGRRYLLVGDSVMEQYWPRVRRLVDGGKAATVTFATRGGCAPIPGLDRSAGTSDSCRELTAYVSRRMLATDDDVVVIAVAWSAYSGKVSEAGAAGYSRRFSGLLDIVRGLRERGKTVWLILPMPTGSAFAPAASLIRFLDGKALPRRLGMPRAKADQRLAPLNSVLTDIATATGAQAISPMDWLCADGVCRGQRDDGTLLYKDGSHLRSSIVANEATFLDAIFADPTSEP